MKMKNRSLATELIFFILACTAMIFMGALAYNYYTSKQGAIKLASENARHLALETVNRVEVILRGVEKVPLNLAANLEHFPPRREGLAQLAKTAVEHNEELFGLGIAFEPFAFDPKSQYCLPYCFRQPDGRLKLDWLGGDSYRYFFADWYQIPKELDHPQWSEPYYDEGGGNIIEATFSVPFYRPDNGKIWGVIEADISLMRLTDIISAVKIYQSGHAFLFSKNGVFVTHPNKSWIMHESVFSVAEAYHDTRLRQIAREMVKGREGFVPMWSFFKGQKCWLYYAPIRSTGWSLGVIIPENELFADVEHLARRTVLILILGLGFLSLVIIAISRHITKPLRTLAQKTEAIAHGDFTASVPESGAKEISHLARSFNRMGQQLVEYIEKRDFIRDTFGRYVTQEVVKRLLESKDALELGGETREVSILMSDLRGFTALTADMHPEQVITFLNRYLGKMIEILTDYQAVIDEIVGDGILAFFGAPETQEDHPARAVACALSMQGAMEEINALNAADGLPHLEMGVAVNTGAVVVGNIGSEQRAKYSVVGAHVNFTSRIESFCLGGQVLVSPSTYARLKDVLNVRQTVEAQMKGIPHPATLYDVRGIGAPYNLSLKERSETLVSLAQKLPVHLYRLSKKIVMGTSREAWITRLSDTAAVIAFEGELHEWEDVRLHLLDEAQGELPGKIYGKVTSLKPPTAEGWREAHIHFTSVSPETYQRIRQATGSGEEGGG